MKQFLVLLLTAAVVVAQDAPFTTKSDVIYGRKYGTALTMDVFTPKVGASGSAVVYVVSGGWFSGKGQVRAHLYLPLLERGHTVFAVVHGSQPKYNIQEIVPDLHRAVRFIRHNHRGYGIEPGRIGIMGASAGGHLSLMIGTTGKPGRAGARDPVERASSRVQAVAAFFPPTDFLNWGLAGRSIGDLPVSRQFGPAFDFRERDPRTNNFVSVTDRARREALLKDFSPIYHVTKDDPPTMLLHGTKDKLVPIQQSEVMVAKFERLGVPSKLLVREGAGHGWRMRGDLAVIGEWFKTHLARKAPAEAK